MATPKTTAKTQKKKSHTGENSRDCGIAVQGKDNRHILRFIIDGNRISGAHTGSAQKQTRNRH